MKCGCLILFEIGNSICSGHQSNWNATSTGTTFDSPMPYTLIIILIQKTVAWPLMFSTSNMAASLMRIFKRLLYLATTQNNSSYHLHKISVSVQLFSTLYPYIWHQQRIYRTSNKLPTTPHKI